MEEASLNWHDVRPCRKNPRLLTTRQVLLPNFRDLSRSPSKCYDWANIRPLRLCQELNLRLQHSYVSDIVIYCCSSFDPVPSFFGASATQESWLLLSAQNDCVDCWLPVCWRTRWDKRRGLGWLWIACGRVAGPLRLSVVSSEAPARRRGAGDRTPISPSEHALITLTLCNSV
jgi:hypothetical protein